MPLSRRRCLVMFLTCTEHQFVFSNKIFLFIFFNNVARIKIRHYRQLYADRPDPNVFLLVTMSTSGHVYDDFVHANREASIFAGELPAGI
jgi:hypothetical protein